MVSRRTDRLLNKITHHTNIYQPFTKYISGEKYPLQDGDKLGTLVKLKYRNKYISDINHISPNPNEYQYPDEFEFTPTPYKDGIFVGDIIEQDFILLRCDLTEPYFMIAMSDDYVAMIVGDSRNYMDIVHKYPKQIEEYLGLLVQDHYYPSTYITSVVLACDSMEPGNSIIAEFYANAERSDYVRFVTDSELESIVMDRYDADGSKNYNGKDPNPHTGLEYIDLDGWKPDYGEETLGIIANGGYPDPLRDMYRKDILSREEVLELRRRILSERIIYGTN